MTKLDQTDEQLLALLEKDATLTVKQLAAHLNLTPTPVHERIKKLKKSETGKFLVICI